MTTQLRKVEDRGEAEDLLERWRRTDLPLATFSRRHGIDGRSLNCWRLNLTRKAQRTESPPRLVELRVPLLPAQATTSGVRLRVGEVVIEVDQDFDATSLARLLNVVRSC